MNIVSYAIPSLQSTSIWTTEGDDKSSPQLIMDQANKKKDQIGATTTTTDNNLRIILDDITKPVTSDTYLSLELPDSTITVEPNK